jgi:RNA polymerase sigma factor (sigma-70 family)
VDAQDSEDGFCEVFDRYAPAILRYAQRRLHSREAAQDVVSDTFTTAWRHWDRGPGPKVLLPWLYAIAGNAVRDQWRSAQRQRRLTGRLSALRPAGHSADPGEGVVLGHSISQALAALPEADREVLRLGQGPRSTAHPDWSPGVRGGFPCGQRSDEFRPRQLSISESQVAYVRRDAYDRRVRVACAAVPAPPVYDAALEVTMCPMIHSFRTSGGVASTGEA